MLYDWTGKPMADAPAGAPAGAAPITDRLTHWDAADRSRAEESNGLSPARLGAIFARANQGDPTAQAKLAEEILEKNWDIRHATGTRAAAVAGVLVRIHPADETDARAKQIADEAQAMLDAIEPAGNTTDLNFSGLVSRMSGALLPGYDIAEIIWGAGGNSIEAFAPLPRDAITFDRSRDPLISTMRTPTGVPLAPDKFVWHRPRAMSGDATRGGLIRPLAWMHLFTNLGVKDLTRFTEKFGMPFVSARLDENAWKTERHTIADLIRNFGSDGGGVFTKAVEIEMIEGNNSNGEVYFKLLEYFGGAITRVVLGQTATSSEGGGWSADSAQAAVRQDLLESDCEDIAASIRNDVLKPWTRWNYGEDAPIPVVVFDYEPPADLTRLAAIAGDVAQKMGYQLDPDWVESTFGVKLARDQRGSVIRLTTNPVDAFALTGEDPKKKRLERWADLAEAADAALVETAAADLSRDPAVMDSWLSPVADWIAGILRGLPAPSPDPDDLPDPDAVRNLRNRLAGIDMALPDLYERMDSAALQQAIVQTMAAAEANGIAERGRALSGTLELADRGPFLARPVSVQDASDWLQRQSLFPTGLDTRGISQILEPPLRNQAFFSASVASANILTNLRDTAVRIASGELSYGEGINALTLFLAAEGYGVPAPQTAADGDVRELASLARLNLVLRQNVDMAHAVGQRRVSEDPGVVARWPNYRYVANTDRHGRFDGLVLPKADPFWRTHYPPWDFGCKCMVLDEEGEPNGGTSGFSDEDPEQGRVAMPSGQVFEVLPETSGYVFDSRPAAAFAEIDLAAIDDARLRAIALQRLRALQAQ